MLLSESIPGVYLIPSAESSYNWFGVIFIRKGLYRGGVFRFNISIPQEFPNTSQPPTVIFQSEVFHPSICPYTGTMDIGAVFLKWISSEHHIWQLVKYIIYLFEYSDQGRCNHKEALQMWTEARDEYLERVAESVRLSCEKLYDPPPTEDLHYITFTEFDTEMHGGVLKEMKNRFEVSH